MIINKLKVGLQVCAVKAPGFGDNRKNALRDLAVATGGKVFGEENMEDKIEEIQISDFGKVQEVVVTKDTSLFIKGGGSEDAVQARIEQIKQQIEDTSSSYEKEKLQESLGRLSNGVAILRVI